MMAQCADMAATAKREDKWWYALSHDKIDGGAQTNRCDNIIAAPYASDLGSESTSEGSEPGELTEVSSSSGDDEDQAISEDVDDADDTSGLTEDGSLNCASADNSEDEDRADCAGEDHARVSYEEKLPSVAQPRPSFSHEETLVIIDWDDTLLPSSWIVAQGLETRNNTGTTLRITQQQAESLDSVSQHAAETLRLAKTMVTVLLVTNAETAWVWLSCGRFMPSLRDALEDVHVISARSEFRRTGDTTRDMNPFEWKRQLFEREIPAFFDFACRHSQGALQTRRNIISLGDSEYERQAIQSVGAGMTNACTKSLKLADHPSISDLRRQHLLLCKNLEQIVQYDGQLDLEVSRPKTQKAHTA